MKELFGVPWLILLALFLSATLFWVLVIFFETICAAAWEPLFFHYGIPIYRKRIHLSGMTDISASLRGLKAKIAPTFWHGYIETKKTGNNQFAFRYSILEFKIFRYMHSPSMRTMVRFDSSTKILEIKGYLNLGWLFSPLPFLFFIVFFVSFLLQRNSLPALVSNPFSLTNAFVFLSLVIFGAFTFFGFVRSYFIDKEVNDKIYKLIQQYYLEKRVNQRRQ